MDSRVLALVVVLVLSALNGLQSPLLPIVLALVSATWPLEVLPRDVSWAFFQSSLLLSTATLLFGGVPAALYERIVRPVPENAVSMYLWIAVVAVLCLPAFRTMGLV
jgi:hypothetical protein